MFLKRIILRGFKTYRDETVIEDFSEGCNLVLGKNGSGKSNLIDAIQFVLTNKYEGISAEVRLQLVYQGVGNEKMNQADVELTFDNTSKRIPIEPAKGGGENATDVRLRRTIGLKKDQFLVNESPYSNVDFNNLIESIGLTRQEPYYIVQQGKIHKLIANSTEDNLNLCKEIAGTAIYDQRKKESKKIMKDTETKLTQIDAVITSLTSRLSELEEESAELKKYLALDTTRRSLEYSIYEQERESATAKLEAIDAKRKDGSGHSVVQGEAYKAAKEAVQSAEEQIEQLQASIKKAQASKSTLTQQQSDLLKRRTELELNVKDVSDRLSGAKGSKDEAAKELKAVQKKVDEARHKLEGLTAEYTRVAAEEEEQAVAYQRLDQRLADLASKRDRSAKYANKKERDADIKKQIARVSKQKADLTKQLESLQAKISESQSASDALSKDIDSKEKQIAKNRDAGEKVNAKLDDLTKRAAEGINARKHAWKKESELASEHTEMSARMEKAQRNLQQTMDKDMHRGLEAIKTIAAELNLDGVYGPLIELFECKEEFHPCVEITAGNSLFSVVVNNSKTAARLIEELQRRKAGRVTFIPLENITPHKPDYPSTQDAMPMLDQLRYDPRFTKAFVQVFGKTLIARDITVAAQLAFAHDLNTITLSGDRVDKKGALTGGFSDLAERGKSRLGAQAEIASQKTRFAEVEAELRSVQGDIATLSAQIEKIQAEMAKHQEHKAQLRSQTKQLTDDVQQAKKEQKALAAEIASNEKLLPPLRASLASTETQLESLESESRGDFHSGLTEEEEGELKRLTGELDQAKKALMKVRASKAEVEASKVQLESLINANLGRREEELNARLYAATQEDDAEALARDEQELAIVRQQVKELEEEMKASEKELHDSTEQSRKLLNDLDKLRAAAADAYAALSDDAKAMDKLMSQRLLFQQKKEDALKKIRDLGALPQEAFEKYRDATQKQLFDKLDKTRAALKKYAGVNKKAADQYANFTEQREDLVKRKKELTDGRTSIVDLIAHLDAKKDEAIERTFKTIAKHFSEVFQELVPGGKAMLVMETEKIDGQGGMHEGGDDDEDDGEERKEASSKKSKRASKRARHDDEAGTSSSAYTGISMKVSFAGAASHTHQLSGGQKSVVALSLIFAIQRCDPSPFYLFDEIDSALDPVARTAVANMVKEQSKTTQFICTTFHPEMLAAAEKMYGVKFALKQSTVSVITHAKAMELIKVSEREAEQQ